MSAEAEDTPMSVTSKNLQNETTINLIDTTHPPAGARHKYHYASKAYDFFRLFKLQFVSHVKTLKAPAERRKIAVSKSRRIAAYHALFQLVPLSGAIALLVLNWSQHFVGLNLPPAAGLQFVAKLHELFMQAAIVEVILCIVRTQIIDGYVPLGILSALVQALQLSYIWSLDFLSAITSQAYQGWRKVLFSMIVPFLILLTALVGPSGAALMIPRPGTSDLQWTHNFTTEGSAATLFPSRVGESHSMTFDQARYENAYASFMSDRTEHTMLSNGWNMSEFYAARVLRYQIPSDNYSVATLPTNLKASLFYIDGAAESTLANWNATLIFTLPRPVTIAKCALTDQSRMRNSTSMVLTTPLQYYPGGMTSLSNYSNLEDLVQLYINQNGSKDIPITSLPQIWSASPEPWSSSIIGIFTTLEPKYFGTPDTSNYTILDLLRGRVPTADYDLQVEICTIAAYWESSRHEVTANNGVFVVQTASSIDSGPEIPKDKAPISISGEGLPFLKTTNFKRTVGYRGSMNGRLDTNLAVIFATILSEVPGLGSSAPVIFVMDEPNDDSQNVTVFDLQMTRYGYGYGAWSASVYLSLTVITVYCLVALGYIAYILITGFTSTAWNSAIELVVLALQSRSPDHLGHTSVGIGSMETFRESVGVRVNDSDKLELVFAHDQNIGMQNLTKVVPNKAY